MCGRGWGKFVGAGFHNEDPGKDHVTNVRFERIFLYEESHGAGACFCSLWLDLQSGPLIRKGAICPRDVMMFVLGALARFNRHRGYNADQSNQIILPVWLFTSVVQCCDNFVCKYVAGAGGLSINTF